MKKIKKLNTQRAALWFFCQGDKFWVLDNHLLPKQSLDSLSLNFNHKALKYFLGYHQGLPCILIDLHNQSVNLPQGSWQDLRSAMLQSDTILAALLGRAWQVANFIRTHQFCGQCAKPMLLINWEVAAQCRHCSHRAYPRISPAVIMAVVKDDQILLAKNKRNQGEVYSVLAGFVEAGETLEDTVIREVKEEVGLKINNIRYFGSQPWPFPHNIMVAYVADYESGDIEIDPNELLSANWYGVDNLPSIPGEHSIARQLINHVLKLDV